MDISGFRGASVNDNTHRQHCYLAYSSVEDATLLMQALGPEACMAKVDIHDAYRLVSIHPADRPFLGVSWRDRVFVDYQIPFGLASTPAIFSGGVVHGAFPTDLTFNVYVSIVNVHILYIFILCSIFLFTLIAACFDIWHLTTD